MRYSVISFALVCFVLTAPLYAATTGNVQSLRRYRNTQMEKLANEFQKAIPADAWKTTVNPATGEAVTAVNTEHAGYKKALADFESRKSLLETSVEAIDAKRRKTFNAIADELVQQKKIVNTGGNTTRLQSDYDWTFHNTADAQKLFDQLKAEGYSPQWDKSGRYFDCPEADIKGWVPHEQARPGTTNYLKDVRDSAANVEIGMNEGELRYLTKDNQYLKSDEGAILGNVKKKVMAHTLSSPEDAIYTEFKTVRKILIQDGTYKRDDSSALKNDALHKVLKDFEDRKTSVEAFDDLSTTKDHRKQKREDIRKAADDAIVQAYKNAAEKSAKIDKGRLDKAASLRAEADGISSSNPDRAKQLRNRAMLLEDGVKRSAASNSMTLQVVAQHNPELAMKLNLERAKARADIENPALKKALDDYNSTKKSAELHKAATDSIKTRKVAKAFMKTSAFLKKDLGKLEKVTDVTGIIGGACEDIERELKDAAAEGRDVSYTKVASNLAKGTGTSLTVMAVGKKIPLVGQVFELATMPKQIAESLHKNQQKRLDEYEQKFGPGHEFEAKLYATFDTFKDVTCIASAEKAIDKVAKEEYELVASGKAEASHLRYYGKVAAESVLEISKINAGMQFGTDVYYGVNAAEAKAVAADRNFRTAVNVNVSQHAGRMTAIREEMNRLEVTYGDDNPRANARIKALEAFYEGEKEGINKLAKRMKRVHSGWDNQTRTIKDKLLTENLLRETDKLKKQITVIAGSGQTDSATVFGDLIEKREKLWDKTNELWDRVNRAQDLYGKDSAHVAQLRDTLREHKSFMAKVNKIDGKTPIDPWPVPDNLKKAVKNYRKWDYYAKVDDNGANLKRFQEDQFRRKVMDEFKRLEDEGQLPSGLSARDAFEQYITDLHNKKNAPDSTDNGDDQSSGSESADGDDNQMNSDGSDEYADDGADDPSGEDIQDESSDDERADEEDDSLAAWTEAELARLEAMDAAWPEPGSSFNDVVASPDPIPVQPYSAEVKVDKNSNGAISRKYSVNSDGRQQGLYIYWRPDGTKQQEVSYSNGIKHGPSRLYTNDGKPREEVHYKLGKRHGLARWFNPKGGVSREESYKDGEKHGPFRKWNEAGFKLSEQYYRDGELVQSQSWSSQSKKPSYETFVGDDGKSYIQRTYDPQTGHLSRQISRNSKGEQHGTQIRQERPDREKYTTIYENGVIVYRRTDFQGMKTSEAHYRNIDGKSVAHGISQGWYHSGAHKGKLSAYTAYKDGVRHGKSLSTAVSGNNYIVLEEGRYSRDLRDGFWTIRDRKNRLKYELNLALGYAQGTQKIYDKDGNLNRIVTVSGRRKSSEKTLLPDGTVQFFVSGQFEKEPEGVAENSQYKGIYGAYTYNAWNPTGCGKSALVDGLQREWFTSGPGKGKVYRETRLKNKLLHGEQKEWWPTGKLKLLISWSQNQKHGPYRVLDQNGELSIENNYNMGYPDGRFRRFYTGGIPLCDIAISNGVVHGKYMYRNRNSQKNPEPNGMVSNGYIDGWWSEFSPDGIITKKWFAIPRKDAVAPRKDLGLGATIPNPRSFPHGPIYELKGGKVKWNFARQKDGQTEWTDDPIKYYNLWVKEDGTLPKEVPGCPRPPIPRSAPAGGVKPLGFDPSTFPRFPSGLSKEKAYEKLMEAWGAGNRGGEQAIIPLLQALENCGMYGHRRNAVAITHDKLTAVYTGLQRWDRALYHAMESRKVWLEVEPGYDTQYIDEKIRVLKRAGVK